MPEALARADYDFSVSEEPPRRRSRPRAADRIEPSVSRVPQMRGAQGGGLRVLRAASVLVRRPLRTLVVLASAAITVSFASNLLFMQEGPHPAPLFAKAEPRAAADLRAESPAPQRSATFAPPPQAPAHAAIAPSRSAPPAIAPAPPARPAETPRAEKPAEKPDFDPIAQFLRTGVAAAPATTASTSTPADAKRVAAVQRALTKLGHKVDADGMMGPGTRAAIEKFERDSRIPVTGDLNARTVRLLSARASIPIP